MYANDLGCGDCGMSGAIAAPARAAIPSRGISLSTPGATAWGTLPATWGSTAPKPVIKPTITSKPISIPMPVLKVPVALPVPIPPVLKVPVTATTPTTTVTPTVTPPPISVSVASSPGSSGGVIVGTLPKTNTSEPVAGLLSALGDVSPNALMFIGLAALVVFMESGNKSRRKGR